MRFAALRTTATRAPRSLPLFGKTKIAECLPSGEFPIQTQSFGTA